MSKKNTPTPATITIVEQINAAPFDGLYAFISIIQEKHPDFTPIPTLSIFGSHPPSVVAIELSDGKRGDVFWGRLILPNMHGHLETSISKKDGRFIFCLEAATTEDHRDFVRALADEIRVRVKEKSIYRGKSFVLKTDKDGDVVQNRPPTFLDLSRVNPEELTFSDETKRHVETTVFTPIEHTAACRTNGVPLKRGILLEGPYGTGKTLTAFVTAVKANQNGWTFIMVDRVSGLKAALETARMYEPAIVFAEDLDRSVSGQERTVKIDDILNTIDGLDSKGTEIMTILTSNDVTQVNRAMLRPGRLDAIISVQAPDAPAVEKLLRLYCGQTLRASESLTEVGQRLQGLTPAVIREVIERAKLAVIARRATPGMVTLIAQDLLMAASTMKHHVGLLTEKKEEKALFLPMTPVEHLAKAIADVIDDSELQKQLVRQLHETKKTVDQIQERLN